ncbi:MAG: HlyD family efflux transporter periplasmic adaptor subunit [Bacillota bacterium]|nr:HlyD family efflux transporter periplasmic adaptor subunit [Bacillota bacterium]
MTAKIPKKRIRPRRRPSPLRRPRRFGVGTLLLVFLVLFVIYFGGKDLILPFIVRSVVAEPGFLEQSVTSDAIVIRQETVYCAPASGKLILASREGERVRAGTLVIEVKNTQATRALDEQVQQVDQRLSEFDKNNSARFSTLEASMKAVDGDIANTLREARAALLGGDGSKALSLDKTFRESMEKRYEVACDLGRLDVARNEIVDERQKLAELAKKSSNRVEAPGPGVVSFLLDGLETQWNAQKTGGVTARSIFVAEPKKEETRTGDDVRAGKPAFRIVSLDQGAVAVALPAKDMVDVLALQSIRVRSSTLGKESLWGKVQSITDPGGDGFGVVVVSISPFPEEALSLRKIRVDLIKQRNDGMKVPEQCLFKKDGETGVYIIYKTMARFRKVFVKARDGAWAIVEGLSPGSEVITNHWMVKEGLRVR